MWVIATRFIEPKTAPQRMTAGFTSTMKTIVTTTPPDLSSFDTLVFAGGGNRCWWQAGWVCALQDAGWQLPQTSIGTSAGAAIAASFLTAGPHTALAACKKLYAQNSPLFDWKALAQLKLKFAHQHIYPAWLASFVNDHQFNAAKTASRRLIVAVSQPSQLLGLTGSLIAGSVAYLLDKKIAQSIHPKLPKYLGLRQAFFNFNDCEDAGAARHLLAGAAAAAPFMKSQALHGTWSFDGGYTDNAPIPPQTAAQKERTLVLLTRHYPHLPPRFSWQGRHYWQPSRKIPVSTWDCRANTTVDAAFELGRQDGRR